MSPAKMAKVEAGIRLVMSFMEALNKQDVAALTKMLHEKCLVEDFAPAPNGSSHVGKEAVILFLRDFVRTFPQAKFEIEEIFGFGHHCIVRWVFHSNGERFRGVDVFKIEDGLIREKFSYAKTNFPTRL